MTNFDQLLPYVNSPARFALAMVAVVLVWILFERGRR
jgi:hypothetical protein